MAIIIGLIFLVLSVWAVLPFPFPLGLGWGSEVISVLKGAGPLIGLFVGLIAVFIGIADLKDKKEAKKEQEAEKAKAAANDQK